MSSIATYKITVSADTKQAEQDVEKVANNTKGSWGSMFDYVKQGFGNAIGSAALQGISSLTSGIVNIGVQAGAAFANYEQLVGGVDKLFGDSSDKLQQYAQNAYKTAGVSANEYMEQVTSFSASLISGLGGDTEKAAYLADVAMQDMADNANTFGTSIESIQRTYQSLSRGQFGMLDNLKLGYGGTAAEMARLINESGVMGEAFEATAQNVKDIPFDKMIEAIHKVQENLKITGTTADEASGTISGSLTSVQAAWQNVLTSLASGNDDFFKQSFDGLIEGISNVITNFSALIPNIVNGMLMLAEAIIAALPGILEQISSSLIPLLPGLIVTIVEAITALFPVLLQVVLDLTTALIAALPDLINAIIAFVISAIPQLVTAAIQLFTALIIAIPEIIVQLVAALPEIIATIITTLIGAIPLLISAAIQLFFALILAIPQIIVQLVSALPQILSSIVSTLTSPAFINNLIQAGVDMMAGLAQGLMNFDIWGIINKIGSKIMNAFTSFFGIHSPSRLMEDQIGMNLGLGVGEGLVASVTYVADDIVAFNDGITSMMGVEVNAAASATGASPTGGGITIQQVVEKPESMLDIQLNTQKGVLLAKTSRGDF